MEATENTVKSHKGLYVSNLPAHLYSKMQEIKKKDGFSLTTQIRKALVFWLENHKMDEREN